MHFQNYLLSENGDAVKTFLQSIGYTFSSHEQAGQCLDHYLHKHGQDGVRQLLPLHPDYDIIASSVTPAATESLSQKETPTGRQSAPASDKEPTMSLAQLGGLQTSVVGIRGDLVNLALILLCVYLLAKIIKA